MSNSHRKRQCRSREQLHEQKHSYNFFQPPYENHERKQNSVEKYCGGEKIKSQEKQTSHQNQPEEGYRQHTFFNTDGVNNKLFYSGQQNQMLQKSNTQPDQNTSKYSDYVSEHQKELKRKKGESEKMKNPRKRNLVFPPKELKYYLDEDMRYETQTIQFENSEKKTFFQELIANLRQKIFEGVGAKIEIFGSFATGLCLPQSDIDIVVIPPEGEENKSPLTLLENIEKLLFKMSEQVKTAKFIKSASVPIIKIECTSKYFSKKIDVTYQDEKHNGLKSVALIKEYLDIYPQLRSLTFILKKFIYCARLFDPYSGGISSYGLILMIVAFIQNMNREKKLNEKENTTLSQLFIGFLHFYGFHSKYIDKKICVLQPQRAREQMGLNYIDMQNPIYAKMDVEFQYINVGIQEWIEQPKSRLVIVDPLNEHNNVGRATHKIKDIKTAFEKAYVSIHKYGRCGRKRQCLSYLRIKHAQVSQEYEGNKRPCCIIQRMLEFTKSLP